MNLIIRLVLFHEDLGEVELEIIHVNGWPGSPRPLPEQ